MRFLGSVIYAFVLSLATVGVNFFSVGTGIHIKSFLLIWAVTSVILYILSAPSEPVASTPPNTCDIEELSQEEIEDIKAQKAADEIDRMGDIG